MIRFAKRVIQKSPLYKYAFIFFYCSAKLSRDGLRRSFAEYQEDLLVRDLIGTVRYFIDVGAADGYHSSNTFYWALRDARGVCFEPLPEFYGRLKMLYWLNRNISCRNLALSDRSREAELVSLEALSYLPETRDEGHSALYQEWHTKKSILHSVELRTFEEAINGIVVPRTIDLLSIDVEGHELNVLRTIPFDAYSFRVVILETHHRDKDSNLIWTHRDLGAMERLLEDKGFKPVRRTTSNTLYLHAGSHRESAVDRVIP
jgi:FkbM family methyltransferase